MVMHARKVPRYNDGYYEKKSQHHYEEPLDRYSPKKYSSSSSAHVSNNDYRSRRVSPCYASNSDSERSVSPNRMRSPSNKYAHHAQTSNAPANHIYRYSKERRDRLKNNNVHQSQRNVNDERSRGRSNERPYERLSTRSIERTHERSMERSMDRSVDRSMDRHLDRSHNDRPMDRIHDRLDSGRVDVRNMERRDRKDREKDYYNNYNDYGHYHSQQQQHTSAHKDRYPEQHRSRSRDRDMKRMHHDTSMSSRNDYREKDYRKENRSMGTSIKKDISNDYHKNDRSDSKERKCGDWSECISSSGKRYYYNQRTGISQWEKPDDWPTMMNNASSSSHSHHYDKASEAIGNSRKEDSGPSKSSAYYNKRSSSAKDDLNDYRLRDVENSSSNSSSSNPHQHHHSHHHSNSHHQHHHSHSDQYSRSQSRHNRYDSYEEGSKRWKGDDHSQQHYHSQHHHHQHQQGPRSSHESSSHNQLIKRSESKRRHRSDSGESASSSLIDKNNHTNVSSANNHNNNSNNNTNNNINSHHESNHNGSCSLNRGNSESLANKSDKISAVSLLQSLNSQDLLSPSQTSLNDLSKLIGQFTSMYSLPDLNELPPQEALRTLQQALALTTQAKKHHQHSTVSKSLVGLDNRPQSSSLSTPLLCSVGESPSSLIATGANPLVNSASASGGTNLGASTSNSTAAGHTLTRQQQTALKEHLSQYLRSHQLQVQQQQLSLNQSKGHMSDSADGIRNELDNLLVGNKRCWTQSPDSDCSSNSDDVQSEGSSVASAISFDDPSNCKHNANNSSTLLTPTLSKYFDERLINHVVGWQTDQLEKQANRCTEEAHSIGSLNATRVSAELKMARSLVRLTEIQATLQEQRILFVRQQISQVEEWKSQNSSHFVSSFVNNV